MTPPRVVTVCGVEVPRHPRYRSDYDLDVRNTCIRIHTGLTRAGFRIDPPGADVTVDMRPVYDTPQDAAAALTRALVALGLDARLRAAAGEKENDHG